MVNDEEELLRSVALRNATSILLARQRAEEEMLQAKASLEARTAELARSLAMLRATLESATDGIIVTDGAGIVTGFNEKYREMWQIPPDVMASGEHRRLLDVACQRFRDPQGFLARVEHIYTASPPESYDLLELADGRVFERFSRIQVVEEHNVGRVWSFRDITERRRAEEALRQQSEWLRITLSSIGDGVISTDAEGRVTFVNTAAEALTGCSRNDAIGRPLVDMFRIVNHTTRQPVENPALQALREGTVVALAHHTVIIGCDGIERPIADSAAPMRDASGAAIGAVLVFRDVSEHMRTEEIRSRLGAIIESSQDAVISKTLDGVIQSWNAEAERLFGYTADEAIGRPIGMIIPPERADEEREIMERLRAGERVEHFETVRVTKDGRRVDISLAISPVRDATGRTIGASKVARDIGERKRIEAALRDAARRKDEFLALLAHELRNPLAPLSNGLEILRLAGADAKAVTQARAVMERQLGHMVRLVDDLLDASRITRNRMELRRSRVLLTDIVSSAVETARPLIEAARHELTISLPAEPIHLDADLTRLSQVFSNLLTNSAKYTERGGRIYIAAERGVHDVIVTVRDTGIGIPAADLPRIFEMFSQVDRAVERSSGGLGIGLALVKGLVEMHGGTVTASSPGPDQGSTFTVCLPRLVGASDTDVSSVHGPSTVAQTRRRILVVDDNRDSASSMATMFKLLGHEVQMTHDGFDALQVAEQFRPEVVLMDVGMPRLDGYQATRRIRQQPWGRDMVIVTLTGWGQEIDKAQSREAGCDAHLVKPVRLADLESLLADRERRGPSAADSKT